MTKKLVKNSIKSNKKAKTIMTVGEFERVNKLRLHTEDKNMKITDYYANKGFPEFSRFITA
jgi:hypothetical protein